MKLTILASLIIFSSLLGAVIKRSKKDYKKINAEFWAREEASNNVRKKSLDDLDYIVIPLEQLSLHAMPDNETVCDYVETIRTLSGEKIVNLNGFSNTDLKLAYGTANLTPLSAYDDNYTSLITTLQRLAALYHDNGYVQEAENLLTYALSIGSDVGHSFYLLARIYDESGRTDEVISLYQHATELDSAFGKAIVRTLKESYPYVDLPRFE